MELNIYEIIKGPVQSEDAFKKNRDLKKLVLEVHPDANKPMIKIAVEKLFNVKVASVNTCTRPGKLKKAGQTRLFSQQSDRKHAIVTLKEGFTIDLFGTQQMATEPEAQREK
jgi:large subunit ribosomal protein L23